MLLTTSSRTKVATEFKISFYHGKALYKIIINSQQSTVNLTIL